jgi:hypothetical protein
MIQLLLGAFYISYRITGAKTSAFILGIVYISILNLVTIYGITQLLSGVIPGFIVTSINVLFRLPFLLLTVTGMIIINYFLFPSLKNIKKYSENSENVWLVVPYTILALIILIYTKFGDPIIIEP